MASNEEAFKPNMDPDYGDSGYFTSHKFEEMFSILDVLSLEDYTHQLEYTTNCAKPNSWEIVIQFEKQVPFNNFNFFVTLRRIDFTNHHNEGILVISFLNVEGKKCPVSYHVKCILKGRGAKHDVIAMDPHFNCLLREEDHLTLPDDVLVVRVELFVRGCCSHVIAEQPEIFKPTKKDELSRILKCCAKL